MDENNLANYKRPETPKKSRSVFSLYFKDGVLTGMNMVMIAVVVGMLGGCVYFATQFYDLFMKH